MFIWTPLITSGDFTGIQTDVLTAATGVIALVVILLGVMMIVNAMKG